MPDWNIFGRDRYREAVEARLSIGDAVAIRVYTGNGDQPLRRALVLSLVHLDECGFTGRDHKGRYHACQWPQALAWEKRYEV